MTIGGGPDWRNVVHPTGLGGMGQLVDPWHWTGVPEEDLTASIRKNDPLPLYLLIWQLPHADPLIAATAEQETAVRGKGDRGAVTGHPAAASTVQALHQSPRTDFPNQCRTIPPPW